MRVLAPEEDIDGVYLGQGQVLVNSLEEGIAMFGKVSTIAEAPANVSRADFRGLRSRMMSNAFAFANLSGEVRNNTSVVLLIEWGGRRLLFVGDAEWNSDFTKGKKKFSWNVMWNKYRELLGEPARFPEDRPPRQHQCHALGGDRKFHGRTGAHPRRHPSPAGQGRKSHRPGGRFDPPRQSLPSIPESELLQVLGSRLASTRFLPAGPDSGGQRSRQLPHFTEREERLLGAAQPWRTDLEGTLSGGAWVEVAIAAKDPAPP